jgi:hypothetical protein
VTRKDWVPWKGASRVMNRGIRHPPNKRHDFAESRHGPSRSAQDSLIERRIPGGLVAGLEPSARAPSLCCPSPRKGKLEIAKMFTSNAGCSCVEVALQIRGRFRHSKESEIERPSRDRLCS